jgi:P27 family predicted phage terminase small subunit
MPLKRPAAPRLGTWDPTDLMSKSPPPPPHLSVEAAVIWHEVAHNAIALGTLRGIDLHALELLADSLGIVRKMSAQLAAEGYTVPVSGGGCKPHPAVRIRAVAHTEAARLLKQFGLMPRGREDATPFGWGILSGLGGGCRSRPI